MASSTFPVASSESPARAPRTVRRLLAVPGLMGTALLASGAAALMNEVVWQRSLKRFLGGSETISSTIVVLVFMGGLGAGAVLMGNRARRFRDPLLVFAAVEAALALVNLGVCALLASDISRSVFSLQRAALATGVPLPLLYAVSALAILALPCLLMGATLPLASEILQRRLGLEDSRVLGLLFFINTFGSLLGCIVASTWLVVHLGLTYGLVLASSLNLLAAAMLALLQALLARAGVASREAPAPAPESPPALESQPAPALPPAPGSRARPRLEEVLALGLGFCSLAYEMLLFRVFALIHEPLPFTFAMVLAGFLLFWSAGAGLAGRIKLALPTALLLYGASMLAAFAVLAESRTTLTITGPLSMLGFVLVRPHCFLPCFLAGLLYATVTSRAAESWGRDVGRVYVWNTVGSCLGILAMTFVGFELHLALTIPALVLLTVSLWAFYRDATAARPGLKLTVFPLGAAALLLGVPLVTDTSRWFPAMRIFFGRDGVVGINPSGQMLWDGLWHSRLVQTPGAQAGDSNWWMAVSPALAHRGAITEACVIGAGVGVTASTLAKLAPVERIDAYEINHTLARVYRAYPEGTMHAAENPRIRLIWQDARTGLTLRDAKYDVITTAPLYLRQSGAALLNSLEFYRLLASRLKPGGVVCLYSYGTAEQAFAVRQTARRVFRHGAVCYGGYLALLSDEPIDLSRKALEARLESGAGDPLWEEVRLWAGGEGIEKILKGLEAPPLSWGDGRLLITDDHPIVEYPHHLRDLVSRLGYREKLDLRPAGEFMNATEAAPENGR